MYDELSIDYDHFVNWQNRLSTELPFILKQLQAATARVVLDAGTGTGMHAIALAQLGYQAFGADLSQGMIEKARSNAASAGVDVRFEVAGFGSLSAAFDTLSFDALLCLGNSLPHLLSETELQAAMRDFAGCLHPGGLLVIQNRNFDAVMPNLDRWMEPQSYTEAGAEWIFQRFYDFDSDGMITFNMVTLHRQAGGSWTQKVVSSRLRPLLKNDLLEALSAAGFTGMVTHGSMAETDFDPTSSPNLVVLARLKS